MISILSSDAIFVATESPEGGFDISHRGGAPGFVKMTRPGTSGITPAPEWFWRISSAAESSNSPVLLRPSGINRMPTGSPAALAVLSRLRWSGGEGGLLPTSLFRAIYICNSESYVILNPNLAR